MKQLIEYKLKDETPILVEVETDIRKKIWTESGLGDFFFENAIKKIAPAAKFIIDEMRTLGKPGDEIEVEFGLGFSSNADAFIAQAGANATLIVRIKLDKS